MTKSRRFCIANGVSKVHSLLLGLKFRKNVPFKRYVMKNPIASKHLLIMAGFSLFESYASISRYLVLKGQKQSERVTFSPL